MFLKTHILVSLSLFYIVMGRHLDFRERFLERKRLRSLEDKRIMALNNYESNNIEVLDDIAHYRKIKGRSSPAWKKIRAIEKDFRRLLAMKGVKYNYKRDMFWRTWRSIPPVNGATKQIVSYKCNNLILDNAKECQSCGMWTIEDQTPPCPFEFFSVLSDERLCGVNYTQYKDVDSVCPSIIQFSDLTATCDNPIETQWRFTKKYGVTEKYNEVICKGQDFCEIFTSYEITPEHVVFRIINSTNNVIYSRIMKAKNKNYICVEDCGRLNPNTKKVVKGDRPLKLDLLSVRKTKREDVRNDVNDSVSKREHLSNISNATNEGLHLPTELSKEVLNEMNDSDPEREHLLNEMNENLHLPTEVTKTEEVLNDIEENMSLSNLGGNDYVHISIERTRPLLHLDKHKKKISIQENSLRKIKSRAMKERQQKKMNFVEDRFLLKPTVTVTPCQKMKKAKADHNIISYEDANSEMEC